MIEDILNLGRLDMGRLLELARSSGISEEWLMRELRERNLLGHVSESDGRFTSIGGRK